MSPKSQRLYQVLLAESPLSAKQLGAKLKIFPSTVYRLAKPLIDMGLINQTNKYPYQFVAKPVSEGLSLFLLHQNDWFTQKFSPQSKQVSLSFIQSRDELMRLSEEETDRATKTVDLLRSGHEIPADLMLSIIKAKERGVETRMLIQDYSKDNAQQVSIWQKNGILVRKTSLRHIRLMIYDCQILYFMSYKHSDSQKDMGMEISYPPFAAILSQLFEEWWQKAEII